MTQQWLYQAHKALFPKNIVVFFNSFPERKVKELENIVMK